MSSVTADSLSIYTELLSNIGQVVITVSLPSPADPATTLAQVSADGSKVQVRHGGSLKEVTLPAPVSASSVLPVREGQRRDATWLAWGLPVASSAPSSNVRDDLQPVVPWSARDLVPESAVSCRACHQTLVSAGKLRVWKDLPSENWAEMMDFWHCHKPHDHSHGHGHGHGHRHSHANGNEETQNGDRNQDGNDDHLTKRGYGANSSIAAQLGVGFVDLTSFVLAEEDCTGLDYSLSHEDAKHKTSSEALESAQDGTSLPRAIRVCCSNCRSHLGLFDVSIASVVLLKWQVDCKASSPCRSPTSSDCLAATLLATLSRSGSSKSVIIPSSLSSPNGENGAESSTPLALNVWILSGNVVYSSTSREGTPRSALKLLYKRISQEEADKLLDSFTSGVQEVNLPAEAIKMAADALEQTSLFLPPDYKVLKGWERASASILISQPMFLVAMPPPMPSPSLPLPTTDESDPSSDSQCKRGLIRIEITRRVNHYARGEQSVLYTSGRVRVLSRFVPGGDEFIVILDKPAAAASTPPRPSTPLYFCSDGDRPGQRERELTTPPPVYAASHEHPATHFEADPTTDPNVSLLLDLAPLDPRRTRPPRQTFDAIEGDLGIRSYSHGSSDSGQARAWQSCPWWRARFPAGARQTRSPERDGMDRRRRQPWQPWESWESWLTLAFVCAAIGFTLIGFAARYASKGYSCRSAK
ncbi:hypothetical protein ACRALDRAFT_1080889 [Sodiomyces alcalophilus JCM 7366]|uniref:uncharacterized protein n=1 Tax=Sodiomyces alcalophilus JCM 7366 TaxID=591952 RepID=UPI0039B6B893